MKPFIKKLFHYINYSMNLKYKLLLSYFVLIIIPLMVYSLVYSLNVSRSTISSTEYSANQMLKQTADLINYKISNIIYVSDQILYDNNFTQTLKQDMGLPISPEVIGDYNSVREFLSKSFKENDMCRLMVYLNNSIFYSSETPNSEGLSKTSFSSISTIENDEWYQKLLDSRTKTIWLPPSINKQAANTNERVISNLRLIRNSSSYSENLGIIRIDLAESDLNETIKKASITEKGVAFIQNSQGEMIVSSNENMSDQFSHLNSFTRELAARSNHWDIIQSAGSTRFSIGSVSIAKTDWVLVTIIPYDVILSTGRQIRNESLILMAIIGSLAYILAYYISRSITKRIRSLTKRMKKVQNGDTTAIMDVTGKDEMSELIQNYNYMISQLNHFSELQFKSGQEVKSAELKALQAQINPHFLYNTLDIINWTALKKNAPEISEIVQALALYYKLSLSKGKEVISIKDEINHISTFVKLQNYRFKNRIHLILDIDQELYQYSILKLILQPIVENSIVHGILEKEEKKGCIRIIGKLTDKNILFMVEDDGVGMSQEQTNMLLVDTHTPSTGFGLKNVNQRIILHYGSEYGIYFKSEQNKGMTVEIKVPVVKIQE